MKFKELTVLTNLELRELSRPSGVRTVVSLFVDWGLISALLTLVIVAPHPLTYVLAFIGIGRQQLALAIMMHDAAHRRLFHKAKINDFVGQFLTAAPLAFSMFSYRSLHLKHHTNPLASDDPDISLIGGYPISRTSLIRKLARDAIGISYFKFVRYFHHNRARMKKAPKSPQNKSEQFSLPMIIFSILLMNGLMLSVLLLLGHGWIYLLFWLLPAWTVLQVLLRIRGIAEHAGYQQNSDQRVNARTVINPLQTFFFAPHNVNYHIEHHLYPSVPHYHLAKVHRHLKVRNRLPEKNVFDGYGSVLRELVR